MNKENIGEDKMHYRYMNSKGNDFVLKRYRLEQNKIIRQKVQDMGFDQIKVFNQNANKAQNIDEDIVIVPLQLDQFKEENIQEQQEPKKQQELVYVFDEEGQCGQKMEHDDIIVFDQQEQTTPPPRKFQKKQQGIQTSYSPQFVVRPDDIYNSSASQLNYKNKLTTKSQSFTQPHQNKPTPSLSKKMSSQSVDPGQLQGVKLQKGESSDNMQIMITDKKLFSLGKLPAGIILKCILKRTSSFLNLMSPQFDLYIANGLKHMLSAKKYPFRNRQIFKFSTDPVKFNQKQTVIANMHANVSHNIFWLLDQPKRIKDMNLSFIHLVIGYYKLMVQYKNRPFTALLPDTSAKYQLAMEYDQNFLNFSNFKQQIPTHISSMQKWSRPQHTVQSSKNFVMADSDDSQYPYLQMHKIGQNVFQLIIQHPLTPLQAMAIAMTRFDVQLK